MTMRAVRSWMGSLRRAGIGPVRQIGPVRRLLNIPQRMHESIVEAEVGDESVDRLHLEDTVEYLPAQPLDEKDAGYCSELAAPASPRRQFVARLPRGRVWGKLGTVVTRDEVMLDEVSHAYGLKGWNNPIWKKPWLRHPERLRGLTLSLAGPGGGNYFHWMCQLLPKFALVAEAGIDPSELDHIIVSTPLLRFHRETLHRLGVDPGKVVVMEPASHYECDSLMATSYLTAGSAPWAIRFLRELFGVTGTPELRLYISRSDALKRRVSDESELVDRLQQHGFESVVLSGMSVADQAALFASAAIVVAPHGAGMTNIVFATPGIHVIELFYPSWVKGSYYMLAHQCGHRYRFTVGIEQKSGDCSIAAETVVQAVGSIASQRVQGE